jgi:ADP-heptose:LPS heptosyltransferase
MSNQILHAQVVCEPQLQAALSAIQHAAVVIGNDTGPRHLAALFGTPCVTLFGPTDIRWTPPAANEHALQAQPFAPGELIADDRPAAFAIDRIPTGDVLFNVQKILNQSER